jgi:hypothetical protein
VNAHVFREVSVPMENRPLAEDMEACSHPVPKMKIAMIGHKRVPSREGGVEIVVEELATRMARMGHDVTLYNRRGHNVAGREYDGEAGGRRREYEGVHIVSVPTVDKKGLAALTSSFSASVRAVFGHYDCIHYHAEGPSVMLLIPHVFHIRTVVTIHGLDWQRSKWGGFSTKYLKLGERIAAKYADEVIVLSENVRRYFLTTYSGTRASSPTASAGRNVRCLSRSGKMGACKGRLHSGAVPADAGKGRSVPDRRLPAGENGQAPRHRRRRVGHGRLCGALNKQGGEDGRILFLGFVQGNTLRELFSNAYIYTTLLFIRGLMLLITQMTTDLTTRRF